MPSNSACNRWIFREGRRTVCGEAVRAALAASLSQPLNEDAIVDVLIRAGELESALADCVSEDAPLAAAITDAAAAALLRDPASRPLASFIDIVERLHLPERLDLSIPEGFAYYALHPLAYAKLVDAIGIPTCTAVIGIRSIGTTLSAVVAAALAKKHVRVQRITVRPTGHPYDRETHFTTEQLHWLAAQRAGDAEFLVVDEGPGLSGSSFLSVGDALLVAGVERHRIRFLCSRQVDPDGLASTNGAERWRGFRSECITSDYRPQTDVIDISAGNWREVLGATVPPCASWTHMERSKFLSDDGRRLFKFAGLGRYGEEVGQRAQTLAAHGFGPTFFAVRDGYAEYEFVKGRPARPQDLSRATLERIADYIAMRAREFRVNDNSGSQLTSMARYNYEQEFGEPAPDWLELDLSSSPVLCDARMQPHEWLIAAEGRLLKTDGDTHGDDHFFPGPCDIAWDLAGAIVEWEMEPPSESALLDRFAALTGDRAIQRIDAYVLAYAVFRASYCRMAAHALRGTDEYEPLIAAADQYRASAFARSRNTRVIHFSNIAASARALSIGD